MKFRPQRYPTRYQGDLKMGSERHGCIIVSISAGGARIAMKQAPREGEPVTVEYHCGQSTGVVKWVRDGEIGVAFDHELEAMLLERVRFGLQATAARPGHMVRFTELR